MPRTIAIIEFDYHAEVMRNTLRILDASDNDYHIFTSQKIWKQVNIPLDELTGKWTLHLFDKKQNSFSSYFKSVKTDLESMDILLFNTLASRFRYYLSLNTQAKWVIRIHNSHAYFENLKAWRPRLTPFFIWKDSSHFVRKTLFLDWHWRKKVLQKADFFLFPSDPIREYAIEKAYLRAENAATLPFAYSSETHFNDIDTEKVSACLIGRIDERNRDYERLISALEKCHSSFVRPFELVLLGKGDTAYGKSVIQRLKAMQNDRFAIKYFDGFVEQKDFIHYINKAHFLLLSVNINTRYTIYEEKYGFTKISGAINDVIFFKKPALINAEYRRGDLIEKLSDTYSNAEDLASKLLSWVEERPYLNFDMSVLDSESKTNIQQRYLDFFDKA